MVTLIQPNSPRSDAPLFSMNKRLKKSPAPRFRRVTPFERKAMLIEAGRKCLARGGIRAFTVDNICQEAGTSRGLIVHHFGSKDALLAAVYGAVYDHLIESVEVQESEQQSLSALVEKICSPQNFDRSSLNLWLALWGEIANNLALQAEHRKHYALFREKVARAIGETARAKGVNIDSYDLAVSFIALFDGLWLEQCIDPKLLSAERAKEACYRMLESFIGPISRSVE
jgi:TetR/AcrR family transcriptional regulator, transcriptional repressor of bet genes